MKLFDSPAPPETSFDSPSPTHSTKSLHSPTHTPPPHNARLTSRWEYGYAMNNYQTSDSRDSIVWYKSWRLWRPQRNPLALPLCRRCQRSAWCTTCHRRPLRCTARWRAVFLLLDSVGRAPSIDVRWPWPASEPEQSVSQSVRVKGRMDQGWVSKVGSGLG